mgnify:CR=1 FL=1
MYAVIRAGGKQHKVAEGDVIQIEKVGGDSKTIDFEPILIVDDTNHRPATDRFRRWLREPQAEDFALTLPVKAAGPQGGSGHGQAATAAGAPFPPGRWRPGPGTTPRPAASGCGRSPP